MPKFTKACLGTPWSQLPLYLYSHQAGKNPTKHYLQWGDIPKAFLTRQFTLSTFRLHRLISVVDCVSRANMRYVPEHQSGKSVLVKQVRGSL